MFFAKKIHKKASFSKHRSQIGSHHATRTACCKVEADNGLLPISNSKKKFVEDIRKTNSSKHTMSVVTLPLVWKYL
jgi:hypothetical protein